MRLTLSVMLGLVLLGSCQSALSPSRETMLREMYMYSMALGPDMTTFCRDRGLVDQVSPPFR